MAKVAKNVDRFQQVGLKIKELRKKKGWAMEKLAYSAGLSKETLRRIEGGLVDVRLSSLDKLAVALGYKVGVLVD